MASEEISNLKVSVTMDSVGFQDGIDKINRQLRIAKSQFDATSAALGDFASETDRLGVKSASLTKQIEIQQQKVELLQKAVAQSAAEKGEDAKQTDLLTIKLNKAQAQLASMQNELNRTTRELESNTEGVKQAASEADKATGMFSRLGSSIKYALGNTLVYGGIAGMIYGVTSSLKSAVSAGIDFDSQMQQNEIGFTTLLGSAQAAQDMLQKLADFAQSTPFDLTGVEQSAKQMLAMGFAAKDILPDMKAIGDAAAALGLQSDGIQRVSLALGQLMTHGKADAQDLLQLTEAGIPVWEILSQAMGKPIPVLQKMVQQGVIPADQAVKALIAGMEQRFPDMLNKMNSSFSSQMGNLRDGFNRTFGELIKPTFDWLTNTALPAINDKINTFRETLERTGSASQAFKSIIPPDIVDTIQTAWNVLKGVLSTLYDMRGALVGLAAGFAVFKIASVVMGAVSALSGLVSVIKVLTVSQWSWNAAMDANPIGAIAAAVGLLIAVGETLYQAWTNDWGGIQEKMQTALEVVRTGAYMVVLSIQHDFDWLREQILNVVMAILNTVSPVAGLIGKIAPGFKTAFDNVKESIKESADAVAKQADDSAVELGLSFEHLQNVLENGAAIQSGGYTGDALLAGRFVDHNVPALPSTNTSGGGTTVPKIDTTAFKSAGSSAGKSFADGYLQTIQAELAPSSNRVELLKKQLQFFNDANDTKDATKATKDLANAYQDEMNRIQAAINQVNGEITKLNPRTHADDIAKLKDEVNQLNGQWWDMRDALQQLNNEQLSQLTQQAKDAANAFQTMEQDQLQSFVDAKNAELTAMQKVHQQALANFDSETQAMLAGIDAQIAALDNLQQVQDRQSQQQDWTKQEGDLNHQLEVAQMMGDPKTVKQVQQQIADLHDQEQKQRNQWARDDQKAALEKQKQDLQAQRDAQKQAMQQMFQDQETAFQNQIAQQQKQLTALIQGLVQAITDRKITQDQANAAWVQAIKDNGDDQVQTQIQGQKKVTDALNKWVQSYVDLGKSYGAGLGSGLVSGLQSMLGAVQSAAAQLKNAVTGTMSLASGSLTDSGLATIKVPAFANGGILTGPTLALAGEAGPEAMLPLNDSTMGRLAGAIASKMGTRGGQTPINIYLGNDLIASYMWDQGLQEVRDRQRKG